MKFFLNRRAGVLALGTFLLSLALGCEGEAPDAFRVQLDQGALDMKLSNEWGLKEGGQTRRVYVHQRMTGVELHLVTDREDMGAPLLVPHVKELIGKELNRKYGGVSTRVSLGGNAMIRYTRNTEDEVGDPLRREEWVLAKPVGRSEVQRVEISVLIPEVAEHYSGLPAVLAALDKRVGDGRIALE
ncbi:MAG: hypothetical protein AB8G23_12500 [Myxococcota bacterium]